MSRLLVPALGIALLALTACSAETESATAPATAPAVATPSTAGAPTTAAADAALLEVTLDVTGMG